LSDLDVVDSPPKIRRSAVGNLIVVVTFSKLPGSEVVCSTSAMDRGLNPIGTACGNRNVDAGLSDLDVDLTPKIRARASGKFDVVVASSKLPVSGVVWSTDDAGAALAAGAIGVDAVGFSSAAFAAATAA